MKPVSSMHPALYILSVFLRRIHRRLVWFFSRVPFAATRSSEILRFSVVSHKSLLMRKLAGTDTELQKNKVLSLRIAASLIDGVVLRPGELFSFWKLIGKPSAARGFPPGLQLSFGSLVSMDGGGLCQLSNLLHWMVLQSALTVVERHRHATDPFPDYRRTVPFGTGATVFYNYIDFAFRNNTADTFQISVSVGDSFLSGELLSDSIPSVKYEIQERNHRFVLRDGEVYRRNELWRIERDALSGNIESSHLFIENNSRVLYDVEPEKLTD